MAGLAVFIKQSDTHTCTQNSHTYLTLSPYHRDRDVIWLTTAGVAVGGFNGRRMSSGLRGIKSREDKRFKLLHEITLLISLYFLSQ